MIDDLIGSFLQISTLLQTESSLLQFLFAFQIKHENENESVEVYVCR